MSGKREQMYQLANEAGLNPIMPDGGYFMIMDLSSLGIKYFKVINLFRW